MAEIVNLRQARKAATRAARARQGDENAARHGLTPAERRRQKAEAARTEATLDAHRREAGDAGPDGAAMQGDAAGTGPGAGRGRGDAAGTGLDRRLPGLTPPVLRNGPAGSGDPADD